MKEREKYIDIAKGIGIIFVVAGHMFTWGGFASRWIYNFHMPLFFWVSGMTFKKESSNNIGKYVIKNIKSLIVPYVLFFTLGLVMTLTDYFSIPISNVINSRAWLSEGEISRFSNSVYNAEPVGYMVGPIWFLFALFWVKCLGVIIYRLFINKRKHEYVIVILCMLFYFMSNWEKLSYSWGINRLPLKLDSAVVGLLFWLLGFYFKNYDVLKLFIVNKFKRCFYTILLFLLSIYNARLYGNGLMSINDMHYGNSYNYIVNAIIGILFILVLSKLIEDVKIVKVLCNIGRNSLYIMGFHIMLVYKWVELLSKVYGYQIDNGHNVPIWAVLVGTILIVSIVMFLIVIFRYMHTNIWKKRINKNAQQ